MSSFSPAALAEVDRAVALLRHGELVGLPTETVYGLAADAANPEAVGRIFAAKGRPADHPLIVHLAGENWVERWAADIPPLAWELAEAFWPGPLTLILKKQPWVPDAVTGGQDTVGLRVPGHPLALELLRRFAADGGPGGLAAPSANRFGRISPTTAEHVREELGASVALVLDGGACPVGIESTIVDLSRGEPVVLRPGHITPAHLAAVIGTAPQAQQPAGGGVPRVSGSLAAHYAPRTPMRLATPAELPDLLLTHRCGLLAHDAFPEPKAPHSFRRLANAPLAYAHDFYAALRQLDHADVDLILVEPLPEGPGWDAVADRLRRALTGAGAA